jgi:ZIP family zinc transporter
VTQTILFAAIASLGLVLGSAVGAFWQAPDRVVATVLAFAAGSLTAALAFELFEREQHDNLLVSSLGLLSGGAIFIVVDAWIERRWPRKQATGLALLATVTLDGVPESLALGVTLAKEGSVTLLVAIFVGNIGEALGGAAEMRMGGEPARRTILLWVGVAVLLVGAVFAGKLVASGADTRGFLLAFGGGAILAALSTTIVPEAYREGGPYVAFATVVGFLVSFLLSA